MKQDDSARAIAQGATEHVARANLFAREAEWRLSDERLVWRDRETGETGCLALADVVEVRLTSEPGGGRHLRLRTKDGTRAIVGSQHQASVWRRENRMETFAPLARATIAQAAVASPQARFLVGLSGWVWWGAAIAMTGFALALAAAFARFGAQALTMQMIVGLALVAFGLPNLVRWLAGNRPASFDPARPPRSTGLSD